MQIPTLPTSSRLIVAVFLLLWGLITHGTFAGSGDEPHYLVIAHSLAFDGDLALDNNYPEATLITGGPLAPEAHAIWRDGALKPVHDVGMPLAFAPVMRIAYPFAGWLGDHLPPRLLKAARLNTTLLLRHQVSLAIALLASLLAREIYFVIVALGGSTRDAFAWALLAAMTPPMVSHSFLFFTEIPSALVVFFVFRRLVVEPERLPRTPWLPGALTGFLFMMHARNIGVVLGLVLVAAVGSYRGALTVRQLVTLLASVGAGVLGRTLTTYLLWGTWLTTPHAAVAPFGSLADVARTVFERSTGLLFDREYGLLAYAPIYMLALPGAILLARARPWLFGSLTLIVGCYLVPILLPATNVHGWNGGWSPPARFLVPVAPLLFVSIWSYASRGRGAGRLAVAAAVLTQIVIDLYVWQFPKSMWNAGEGEASVPWSAWLPSWTEGDAAMPFGAALLVSVAVGLMLLNFATRAPLPSAAAER